MRKRLLGACGAALLLVSCVRTCVGVGELGSKERPAVIALEGWPHSEDSIAGFSRMRTCLEEEARYRVAFEIQADIEAVVDSLLRQESLLGVVNSASYVTVSQDAPLEGLYMSGDGESEGDRSVIIGRRDSAIDPASADGRDLLLQRIHGGVVAYLSQSSDVGFLVGRHLLYERGVLPSGAIFTSAWAISEALVQQGRASAAVLSESYLRQAWGVNEARPGLEHDQLVVLQVSPLVPGRMMIARNGYPQGAVSAIVAGLEECAAREDATGEAVARTLGGRRFEPADQGSFGFLRRVTEFQETFVRILPDAAAHEATPGAH